MYQRVGPPRLILALLLILIGSPSIQFSYLLFPEGGLDRDYLIDLIIFKVPLIHQEGLGWYYLSHHWLFLIIGKGLAPVLMLLGLYYLLPKKSFWSYLLLVLITLNLVPVIQALIASDYQSFHPNIIVVPLILGSAVLLLIWISSKVLFRKSKDYNLGAISVLILHEDLDWSEKEQLLKREIENE